ncbi:hypothetical protein JCM10449v2_004427 [Rhodotorula kratochvilovae]
MLLLRQSLRLAHLVPLQLTLPAGRGGYSEVHHVPWATRKAVEAPGKRSDWGKVRAVLLKGEGAGAFVRAVEDRALAAEMRETVAFLHEMSRLLAVSQRRKSYSITVDDTLKSSDDDVAAARKMKKVNVEANWERWWTIWRKTLQNIRDYSWQNAGVLSHLPLDEKKCLAPLLLNGRRTLLELALRPGADILAPFQLHPTRLENLDLFLVFEGLPIIHLEQALFAHCRHMMHPENREELEPVVERREQDVVKELYRANLATTPAGPWDEDDLDGLLRSLTRAYKALEILKEL